MNGRASQPGSYTNALPPFLTQNAMIDNNMTNERLKALFETHPAVDVVFIAADGMPFLDDLAAHSHAQRLFDKNVLEISREDLEDYDPATFADGLGADVAPEVAPLHPSIAGPYNEFLQTQGGGFSLESGGVIVPPSNILAHEEQTSMSAGFEQLASAINGAISASLKAAAAATPAAIAPVVDAPAAPTALEVAYSTPEAERTPYQKGLITKAENAADKAAEVKGESN